MKKLILASKSPRRHEILEILKIPFKVEVPIIDETPFLNEDPYKYVIRISNEKATSVYNSNPVIAADTIVYYKRIYGKPKDKQQAYRMIKDLSGKTHKVITGVTIIDENNNKDSFYVITKVAFDKIKETEILNYINLKEPYDKAGGYAIQGEAAKFIKEIKGCYYNVMGFPINEIYKRLKRMNIS